MSTKDGLIEIVMSQCSAIYSTKWAAARMLATVFRLADADVEHTGNYPGWKPNHKSEIVLEMQTVRHHLAQHCGDK